MLTVEGTAVKGVVFMNRIFKVIFNRNRQLVQVVPEYAKNRGKEVSESRKGGVRGLAKVLLTFLATLMIASPGYAADETGSTGSGSTGTSTATATVSQVVIQAGNSITVGEPVTNTEKNTITYTISANGDGTITDGNTGLVTGGKVYTAINNGIQTTIGSLSTNGNYIRTGNSVSGNLVALDTQVKSNADNITKNANDISTETTARETADNSLSNKIGTLDANGNYIQKDESVSANLSSLDTQVKSNTTDITGLKDLSNITSAGETGIRKQAKKAVQVAATGNATVTTKGSEDDGNTLTYTINVAHNGEIKAGDTNLVSGGTLYTELRPSKGIYVNSSNTTAANLLALDTNLKNVIDAIGLDSDDTTTSYTSKLNKYFKVNPEITTDANGTKTYAADAVAGGTNSVAIGPSAKVDTASDALALGTGATVNQTATSGVAIGKGAVTGSADKTITVNNLSYNVNAAGGVDSVAIGTDASNAGNTSIALGKGAMVKNDSDGSYQAVVKSDDIAIGTDAKTSASDFSTAIGKGSSVTQSTDALAVGSGAKVTTSKNAMAFGKGADAESAADSIAMGTSAKTISADTIAIGQSTSATGANSVVIGKGATTMSEGGNAIGSSSTASGNSTAIGQSATANNYNAVAIGNGATANADKSIALGYQAGVGTSEGKGEPQNAGSLIAIGTSAGNNVSGMQNVAIGESAGSNVKSSNNIAIGTQAGYGINYASDDKAQNGYNVSIGYKANYQENAANIMYATALGNEANASNYAVAIGDGAKASGTNSLALGYSAQASDAESMALGHNASAADGNIAIGDGSSAPSVSTLGTVKAVTVDGKTINYVYDANNNQFKSAFTYKPLQADSHYISVGSSTLTRRISNVADGVFASDAATVGQLNSLNELLQATDTKVGLTKDYFEQKFTDLNTTVDASKTHYFSVSTSSDNQTVNQNNTGATSGKADAMAIGPNANAANVKSLAVGNNVYATGLRSIAIGTAPNPTTDSAGTTTTHNTSSEGENSIALGTSTTAQADNSIAIGTRAQTYTTDTTSKTGAGSVAIGNLATTAGNQSVALGYDATVKYNYGTAIGAETLASGNDAVAIGKGSKAYSTDSTAIGQGNSITGNNVYGLGSSNEVSGKWGAVTQSGISGYQNTITSVSDQDTTNALKGIYMTGNANDLNQQNKYNVMEDITVQGSSNKIYGGPNISAGHPNTLSQIAIVGSDNTVQGKSADDGMTNNIKNVTILGYNNKVSADTDTTVNFSETQILGSNVTAKLGNSVYLGSNAAYTGQTRASSDAITSAKTAADTAAEASDAYKAATTDAEKAQIKAQYEAQYLYQLNVQAMEASGTTAGTQSYSTDTTYDDGTSYTYAGSSPVGVVTVGKAGSERRIQNVAAGLVSASSTDAVNGSQLYALTRQIRFGGDNSSFGTTTADDKNVVARGSNETLNIIGGEKDTTKLTDNNIGVLADSTNNTLTVKLASNLEDLNTAQLGSGSGDSYKETIKLDGTGTTGGQMTLAGADGTVKTTLDTTGLTIANGPKFTSSGIDAASQKINHVTAGTDDADAANVGQVNAAAAEATTEVKAGTNASLGTVETSAADKHKIYTVNVDNLAVKAANGNASVALANGINFKNGTNTTSAVDASGNVTIDTKNLTLEANGTNKASVSMDGGINFKNGTNTTATVDTDGTVTISATHNKLDSASYTASKPSDSSNQTTVKLKDTDGNETTLNLTDTYTTVSKNTDHTISFKRNDGSNPVSISLDDLDGASNEALTKAAAKATTTVIKGTNVDSVDDDTTSADGHHIYKVNVSNLGVKVADGQKKSVALSEGLVFGNGTNTTASVGDNGAITFNVSNDAIKTQAKDAINMSAGSNVKVETTSTDGLSKTFTISATHNALKSATLTPKSNDVSTLTITGNDGDTASVDIKNTHLTVTKDSEAKTVTFTSNDGTTPETTLSLSDLGAASTADMNAAKAAASTEVKAGTNASLGTVETNQTDQHKIYTVNVDNLGLKQNGTAAGTVTLADGINFADGTNTSATVSNGKVTFDLKKDITNIDTITASNSIQAGNVKVGKQGADNKNYVTGLENKNWTVGQTTYEAGRAATEDQLKSVSDKVASGFQVTDGTTSANIGADKKVTFTNGNYTTAKVTQATDGANVQYDINTAKLTTGANGTITAPTTDGVATAANVAEAINSAAWKIKANDNDTTAIKAGTTVRLKAGNNLTLSQSDTDFTYALNDELTGIKSLTTAAQDGVTTTLAASGVTIASSGTGNKSVSLTANGLNNGGKQITDVASGGDTDTNAANISDVKRLVQASASGTTETGFNVKGDDATAKKVKLGKQLNVVGGTNDTSKLSDGNIGVVTKDDGQGNATLTVKLNKNINLDSVKAGNTTLDTNGLAISGGPTIAAGGINAGGKTITGVANGVGDNDAVNISQLKAVQSDINAGWTIKGKDTANADVSANIGKGKTVTYDNGNYTKSVVTKDDTTGNATVKVDVTTGTLGFDAGKAASVTNGLATTQDVANAINSASISVVADNTPENKTAVKAGDTIHFAKDDNLTLTQDGTKFTYGLKKEISISKVTTSDATNGSTVQDAKGITTTDAAGNTYIQNGQGITLTSSDKTKSPVKLTNTGLNNGGNKITDVADGELTEGSKEAVNGGQLYELKQKVGSGWKLTGDDTTQATNIGAGAQVSVKSGNFAKVTVNKSDSGATIQYDVQTQEITTNGGKAKTAQDGVATTQDVVNAINDSYWTVTSGQTGNGKATGTAVSNVTAGTAVTLQAGDNLLLNQAGNSFTYALNPVVTGMTSISFTGMGTGNDGKKVNDLVIGLQNGGGANTNKGYFITGLSNTEWNQSNYQGDRAATEAQLKKAIENVSIVKGGGGYGLTADEGANNGGDKNVTQALGSTIAVRGDGTYDENGNLVKTGNVKTVAYTDAAGSGQTGAIQIQLNKDIDLGTDGSLQAGGVTLQNNSVTVGTNGVVISSSGSERTVSNLSNIHWDAAKVSQDVSAGGYKNSGKAATEGQLAEAISTATSTAAQNEKHIRNGEYSVQTINNADGSKSQGVSIDIITGDGSKPEAVKGHVVIKDVAKASDLGNVSDLHDTLKNADGKKNVTGALNNLDDRVTGLDNRMDNIYTTAGQHSSVSSESNIVVDHSAKNESGGTDYKLSLNREKIDLDKVTIEGKSGAVTAKTVTAEEYKVGNKTYISSDGLNANSQKITNVQAGTADTDAANVGQVREADEQLAGGIAQNARNISQLGREVDKLDSRIDRVGAGAAALAALHPGAYDPNDKVDFSAGYGNYRGASAAAVGMYYHPDARTILSMGVAMGGGENMVNAGVTWKLGRRTPAAPQPVPVKAAPGAPALVPVSTAAAAPVRPVETASAVRPVAVRTSVRPVETVALVAPAARVRPVQPAVAPVRTADTNAQLMELLARQTAILEKLSEQKAVPAAAPAASGDDLFTDVPENHWAYECALKMEKAGVLKGLGGLQVEGNPLLTRKDFARILYTALKNGATTNPALNSDNSLNRMASEFRGELKMVKG